MISATASGMSIVAHQLSMVVVGGVYSIQVSFGISFNQLRIRRAQC